MGKKKLSDQVVVVAGGSYGLGRAIVRAVAERGAKVAIGARDPNALAGAVGEVEAAGSEAISVETDVTWRDQVENLVRTRSRIVETPPGDPGAHGRFDDRSRESTAWTWARLHGGKQALIALGVLAGAGVMWGTMGLRTVR